MAGPDVVLVSRDLLFASRLRAALAGRAEVRLAADAAPQGASLVFVDLNADVDARVALIRALRGSAGPVQIIGFCGHDDRAVRVRAMDEGADQVVTNGALQEAALRLVALNAGG